MRGRHDLTSELQAVDLESPPIDPLLEKYLIECRGEIFWDDRFSHQSALLIIDLFSNESVERLKDAQLWLEEAVMVDEFSFHRPEFDAVFEDHRAPFWEIHRAVVLSFGKNPYLLTPEYVATESCFPSLFVLYYDWLAKRVQKAVADGRLRLPLRPRIFVDWLCGNDEGSGPAFVPPAGLEKAVPLDESALEDYRYLHKTLLQENERLKQRVSKLELIVTEDRQRRAELERDRRGKRRRLVTPTVDAILAIWGPRGPGKIGVDIRRAKIAAHLKKTLGIQKAPSKSTIVRALRQIDA